MMQNPMGASGIFDQSGYDIRCEWGERGIAELAHTSNVVIIVDVFSFSTCIEIAANNGAVIYPYGGRSADLESFAAVAGALVVRMVDYGAGYPFSPQALLYVPSGTRLVLPSRNGAIQSLQTGATTTLAGCLRNARAVALAAQQRGPRIAVIPAGERWKTDDTLRPAYEDWIGAGAIIRHLRGSLSPEARAAVAAFQDAQPELSHLLHHCSSGRELIHANRAYDVALTVELDASECVPILVDGAYVDARRMERR
jgi:2-phosphosulfolactate phosphatase